MIRIRTRDEMHIAVQQAARLSLPQLPLFQAAASGRIAFAYVSDPNATIAADIQRERRPIVLVVGDDPNPAIGIATGPGGWKIARRLQYWRPHYALVHGTGGKAEDYRTAAKVAEAVHRFLLIETSSKMASAWHNLVVPMCPTVVLVPREGVHPVRGTLH